MQMNCICKSFQKGSSMKDVIIDTILDTARLIPFLYITYLIMGILEKRASSTMRNIVRKSGKAGPILGSMLGIVPQCGFSAAASSFYAGRIITLGTLISIYLSTSDEMLPILLSESSIGLSTIIKILLLKMTIGMIAGFLIDFIFRNTLEEPKVQLIQTEEQLLQRQNPGNGKIQPAKMQTPKMGAGRKQSSIRMAGNDTCNIANCICGNGRNPFWAACIHTFRIVLFIMVISFALNLFLLFVGEDALKYIFLNKPIIGELSAALIGLIPNCAASVVLTQLYVEGALSFGACMAGLLVGAGIGILVLFRANNQRKDTLRVICLLYGFGENSGILINMLLADLWR